MNQGPIPDSDARQSWASRGAAFAYEPSPARPLFDESRLIWRAPVFSALVDRDSAPEELLGEIGKLYSNGGAAFARFRLADDPRLAWFVARGLLKEIDFLDQLLTAPALLEALPDLAKERLAVPVTWEQTSPYVLDGEFASLLMCGGAYARYSGPGSAAKAIGRRACDRLFGERFEDMLLFETGTPWSGWFHDVAWDNTWVGVDLGRGEAWILCTTDAD